MLTRPSAAHEIYLSLFSGVYQVSRAIFGHLALVAYPDSSNRFGCDNYARALLLSMSPSAAGEGPRMFMITKDDHGGIIVVVGCIMMTWTLLCFMIRMYNRFTIRASLGLDDFACGLSTAFGVAQTLMMCVAVSHGFGKSAALSSSAEARLAEKYMYAVAIVSLCAIAVSKAAMLFFHLRITPRRSQRITCYVLAGICGLWMVVVMALAGTRCEDKTPWLLYGRTCHTFSGRWIAITIADSILELAIFAVPFWILYPIDTHRSYKSMILIAFASRLLVPIFAGIHVFTAANWATTNPPFGPVEAVLPFLWLNVETNYAIMAATFPTLGLFVKSLNTRWGALDGPDVTQYTMESLSESSRVDARTAKSRRHLTLEGEGEDFVTRLRPDDPTYSFRMRSPSALTREDRARSETRESDDSDQMIIRKTVSTSVERGCHEER